MKKTHWTEEVIAAATNFADKMREVTEPFREFGDRVEKTINLVNAYERANVAFPSRDDVARYAILAGREDVE